MSISPELQAEIWSMIHQFLLNTNNKSLANQLLSKTKVKPRAKNLPTLTDIVSHFKKYNNNPAQNAKKPVDSSDDSSEDEPKTSTQLNNSKSSPAVKKQDSSTKPKQLAKVNNVANKKVPAKKQESSSDDSHDNNVSDDDSDDEPHAKIQKKEENRSVPILSLEEEGGLFVMYGKENYPVAKDGKIVKIHLNYIMDDKPDQEESFWKLKYMKEKKKTSELKKLLIESKEQKEETSRVPPAVPSIDVPTISEPPPPQEFSKPLPVEPIPVKQSCQETDPDDKKIKVKFTKNNEEVELEGHWPNIKPVLSHVAELLREPETTSD